MLQKVKRRYQCTLHPDFSNLLSFKRLFFPQTSVFLCKFFCFFHDTLFFPLCFFLILLFPYYNHVYFIMLYDLNVLSFNFCSIHPQVWCFVIFTTDELRGHLVI